MSPTCGVEFPEAKDSQTTSMNAIAWAKCIIEDGIKAFLGVEATVSRSTPLLDLTVIIKDSNNAELLVPTNNLTYFIIEPPILLTIGERA